jgi:hypothetical protein
MKIEMHTHLCINTIEFYIMIFIISVYLYTLLLQRV